MADENFQDAEQQLRYKQMAKPENITIGRGKIHHSQTMEIVYSIYCFILAIHTFLPKRGTSRVRELLELATGVNEKTIQNIKEDYDKSGSASFHTPEKQIARKSDPIKQAEEAFMLDVLRRTIYQLYAQMKKSPTLDEIHKAMVNTDTF